MQKLKDDIAKVKPTIFFSVPRLYNRFYEAINTKFKSETGVKKSLIDSGLESKKERVIKSG